MIGQTTRRPIRCQEIQVVTTPPSGLFRTSMFTFKRRISSLNRLQVSNRLDSMKQNQVKYAKKDRNQFKRRFLLQPENNIRQTRTTRNPSARMSRRMACVDVEAILIPI